MIWHPYTIGKQNFEPLKIKSAKGEFLISEDDKEYVDLVSSWWVSIHGHNHPFIKEKILSSLEKLDFTILAGHTHEAIIQLTKKLLEFTENKFHKIFYSDNGSNAVEIALKMSIQYFENLEIPNKKEILHFSSSYHGDSIGAMSVSGKSKLNDIFKSIFFESTEFISPDCYNCPVNKNPNNCNLECIDKLEVYLEKNHKTVASVIIEPIIQAALGMKFYKKEVLQKMEMLCNKYNVLFILDEVFTGFGRLGKKFAFLYAEISPDIICLAKGLTAGFLPMAATLVNKKVYEGFYFSEPEKAFYHGHTMTGNPASASAACASIELFEMENRLDDIKNLENFFQNKIIFWKEKFDKKIFNPRNIGAVFTFEMGNENSNYFDIHSKKLKEHCFKNQILIRPLGNTVYITPPYTIDLENLENCFRIIESFLKNE